MIRPLLIFTFSLLIFCSCKKDVGYVNYGDFPKEIGSIINYNCAVSGCHDSKSYEAAAKYDLSSWNSMFKGSGSGSPVIPFNSKFSSLCYFINTFDELGIKNEPVMPLNKKPLSYQDVKTIFDWIDQGAPDVNGNVKWADNPLRSKLYAVNQGCDVVTVFDSETQLPIRYIEVGTKGGAPDTPHMVRVSPDGQYWYVIFIADNVMQKYRCSDDAFVANIPLTPLAAGTGTNDAYDWNTFVITKDSKKAYAVSWTSLGKVACVDLENHSLLNYIAVANNPHAIALSNDETKIYVGAQTGNYLNEIPSDFSGINQISIDANPPNANSSLDIHDMILSPNGVDLVITCQKTNEVRVFNTNSSSVTAVVNVGIYPQEIVYSNVTNEYLVTCMYDNSTPGTNGTVARINGANYTLKSNFPVGAMPHGLAVDEKKKLLYVLSRNIQTTGPAPHHSSQCAGRNGFVSFISLPTFSILNKRFELSVDPYFISYRK
ncbi:MAG: hypothetical protein IPM51_13645 [Sphingobacteriaceae bacterium]|nr:hypothetical protein [Sphingobacteriaceae bacterium]